MGFVVQHFDDGVCAVNLKNESRPYVFPISQTPPGVLLNQGFPLPQARDPSPVQESDGDFQQPQPLSTRCLVLAHIW